MVYVGSGRYLSDLDVPGTVGANTWATQNQSIYGVIDNTSVLSPTLPNIRGSNGTTCPVGGGNGDLVCLTDGRVVSKPALTTGGTLTLTVNIPTNLSCDPGGSSWFLALGGANGGAVAQNVGGNTCFDSGFLLGCALASRPVIVQTANGRRALIRMSDRTVQAPFIPESASAAAQWRRIYWRAVN